MSPAPQRSRLVSVCIPTLTKARLPYLREAVDSALRQTHGDVEVLISDDGRDEEVSAFAEEQRRLDPRVHYTRNERRLGLGGNWNAVAGRARGEYLIIIGDDDRLLPTFAERLLAASTPRSAVLFSNHWVIDENGARLEDETEAYLDIYARRALPAGVLAEPAACVWKNSVPMSASLIRTADVQRLGIKTDLNTPEIELFARIAAEGGEFVFVPERLAEYRVHRASATSSGLATERLIPYLEPIVVPPEVEPLKRAYVARLVAGAVTRALGTGDIARARALMQHPYYPSLRRDPLRVAAHHALATLPPPLSKWSHGVVQGTARRVRAVLHDRLHFR